MHKRRPSTLLAALGVLALSSSGQPSRLLETYSKLPLRFEASDGQADGQAKFTAHAGKYSLFLTSAEAILALKHASVRMRVAEANPAAPVIGVDELPGTVNYFIGNDPQKWRSNVRSFAKVRYRDVYPGVDLIYYGNQRQLEYDFIVAPGADPRNIALDIQGADPTRIDRQGDLVLKVPDGEVRFHKPLVYLQDPDRTPVSGRYALRSNRVGFELAAYDRSKTLVIDPVVTYATYLGGASDFGGHPAETNGFGIAVDPSGNTYVTGTTNAVQGFPVVSANQSTAPTPNYTLCPALDAGNVFVAKLSPTGTPVYITYLGGTHCNQGLAVAADASGNASVTGWTESNDFPTTPGAFLTTRPNTGLTAFLTKFNATGGLAYSTFVAAGRPGSVAVDGGGNVYLTGSTDATLSAKTTSGAYRTTCAGSDTYILKFSAANALLYASCLASNSGGSGIAVDPGGNLYVLGGVNSPTDFLAKNGFQASVAGRQDAFVAKLHPGGAGAADLLYATFFGGSGDDEANGVAADALGNAYIVGNTGSSDLPVTSPSFKSTCLPQSSGACTGFVAKFNTQAAGGTSRVFATYLGGSSGDDAAQGIAVDSAGNGYVTGYTASSDFPTVNPIYQCPGCAGFNESMFVTEFSPAGSILFSTFLGGSATDSDEAFSIALDPFGAIYLTGIAGSQNLPPAMPIPACMNPVQSALVGGFDAFVVKLSGGAGSGGTSSTSTSVTSSANPSVFGQAVSFTATVSSSGSSCGTSPSGTVTFRDGAAILGAQPLVSGVATLPPLALSVGGHSIMASYSGDANFTSSTSAMLTQTVNQAATTTTLTSAPNPATTGQNVTVTATVTAVPPGAGTPSGTVNFSDGTTPLGPGALISGSAPFNTSTLSLGNHSITAAYVGDTNFKASTSSVLSEQVITSATAPSVTTQPTGQVVCAGQVVNFTAAASGSPTPTVQWQVSVSNGPFTNISQANSPTLTFVASALQDGNQFQAVFTNASGVATTVPATLSVNTPTSVIVNPASQTIISGQSVTFTAAAIGKPVTAVQWQVSVNNGPFTNIPQANSPTLTFTTDSSQNGNQYQAVFANPCGVTATTPATLTVNVSILINESIKVTDTLTTVATTPPVVTAQPAAQAVCTGQNVTFTATASGVPAPTVQWQVSVNNGPFANIPLANSNALSFTANTAQNGNQYRAVFTNVAGMATTNPATLTINTPPLVTLSPASQTVTGGQSVTFMAAASGASAVQWQVSVNNGAFTNILLANSPTLTFTADPSQNGNRYQAVFTNPCGVTTTTPATLTVNLSILINESIKVTDTPTTVATTPPIVTLQPSAQALCAGQSFTFTAAATGVPAPTVQWQVSVNNGAFTNIPLANSTTLTFSANSVQNGNRYRAVFTNVAGNATTNPVTLTINTPPLVTLNPASQAVNSGQSVTFTAAASGAPTVQWQVSVNNGPFTNILLANSPTLTFTADLTQNGNRYQAVFTGPCGVATTSSATLSVNVVILVNESIKVTDSPAVSNTSSGNNVAIKPVDTTSGSSPVTLTFTTVTQPGLTSLTTSTNGPPPPTGFQLGNPAEYYNLTTTATFTGTILVCINYTGISFVTPPGPRLFHFENGSWVDRTVSVDTTNMIVCGSVTSLSPFALFRQVDIIPPTISAALSPLPNAAGWNNSNVTVTLTSVDNPGGSGVKQIAYSATGGQTIASTVATGASTSFSISAEGVTTITFFGTDNAGNVEAPKSVAIRLDKTPPALSCNASPNRLWPPDNKLTPINVSVNVADSLSGPAGFTLLSVASNEPDSGSGDIQGWAIGTPGISGELRATRLGQGNGRIYTLTYRGSDQAGNTATCTTTVTVPHDQSNR